MRFLFIGGNGNISWECTRAAIAAGHEVWHLNRGFRFTRPVPPEVIQIRADIRNPAESFQALASLREKKVEFDSIVDWVCFHPNQARQDVRMFQDLTRQFVFISSASAYQKPLLQFPITEETPMVNPYWEYSRNKIACEQVFFEARHNQGFPATIVRPSHTYDTFLPVGVGDQGYTFAHRLKLGKPMLLHGDGTSLWTLTHSEDFARGFLGVLGNEASLGEAYHITSDEVLNWRQIYSEIAEALAIENPRFASLSSASIAARDADIGAGLLGDKAWCAVFDNSKIKALVPGFEARIPFKEGLRRTLRWFHDDPSRQWVDAPIDTLMDRLLEFASLDA